MNFHFVQSLEILQGGGLGSSVTMLQDQMLRRSIGSKIVTTHFSENVFNDGLVQKERTFPKPYFYAKGLRSLVEQSLSAYDSKVIHSHGFYFYPNYLAGAIANKYDIPMVYHVHGMFEPYILNRSKLKKGVIGWLYEDNFRKNANVWRALTEIEADQIRNLGFRNIEIIPNGIDTITWSSIEEKYSQEKPYILFLSRVHPKKGLLSLIEAWSKLPIGVRNNVDLLIAGPDENNHMVQVNLLIQALNLTGEVKYIGTFRGEEKIKLFNGALAYVLTSFSEGLPMTCLEAMASKKPLIVSQNCNLTKEVNDYDAGIVVNNDINRIFSALLDILRLGKDDLSKMGENSWKLVSEKFNWDVIIPLYQELEDKLNEG